MPVVQGTVRRVKKTISGLRKVQKVVNKREGRLCGDEDESVNVETARLETVHNYSEEEINVMGAYTHPAIADICAQMI